MLRWARWTTLVLSATAAVGLVTTSSLAGMAQDISDCNAADRKTSAAACTRVLNSGRLWDNQVYIGYYNRAWSHFNAGDDDKALADFDKSIARKPDFADSYLSRAEVQQERGALDRSRADLDLYLEKKGETAEAYLKRARVFRRRGDLNGAFSELQRAGSLDPGDRDIRVARALVLSDLGEQGPARREADDVLGEKADDAGALYARAWIAFREDKLAEAAADLDKALAVQDKFPAVYALKGEIAERRGDTAAAIASYRRVLELSPRSLDGRAAHQNARTRLAALDGSPPPAAPEVATAAPSSRPADEKGATSHDCRRFIPEARTTVAVACAK
jgi:tetratricopeptide (TPR) repeat protein